MSSSRLCGKTFFLLLCCLFSFAAFAQTTLIPYGSSWKYLDNGTNQGTAWRAVGFADGTWSSGLAQLGYGDGDEVTVVSFGPSSTNKFITTYFRYTINIPDPSLYSDFTLHLLYDDGGVVYVNGTEVARARMTGAVAYTSLADNPAIEDQTGTFTTPSSAFVAGTNVVAVEIHQQAVTSSDISFDLELIGNDLFSGSLTRGPYLQMGNQTEISLRWRTGTPQNSRVEIGTVFGSYPTVINDAALISEHNIRITGLSPDTKYFYRVGNSTNMGAPDNAKFFTTAPAATTTRKIRIAAFGDCGRGNSIYQDQNLSNYRNYLATNGIDAADAWILLGDNAYDSGTDDEFSNKFFGIYAGSILKNHKLYPAPGNHDYGNNTANKSSRMMPYYNSFTVPQNAECGGVASNKPNYYSFDIGNIHFLSLDSWGIETDLTNMGTSGNSSLKAWIDLDLAANTKKWVIAYWHHPPYTKGGHDSDTESELADIRQNFISFLEARGVDMVICGHSHSYERGYLMKNFTGAWTSFNPATHAVSTSSATYTSNSTCPFIYNSTPLNHGTVYVVAGSTGASSATVSGFGANGFPFAVNDGGVFYFEVEDNRLDAKMLRRNGTVFDRFTIMKDVNKSNSISSVAGQTVNLTASWPGNATYNWNHTSQTTRTVAVAPPAGTYNYTVSDNFGCVTDQFTVNVSGPLPVQIVNYEVSLQKEKVNIDWSTAAENNSKLFTVEKSADGNIYSVVSTVSAKGNSSSLVKYSVVDQQPLKGLSYYRLSQTDIDGNTKLYEVKKIVNRDGKSFEVKLSQARGALSIDLATTVQGKAMLRIYDMSGRLVRNENWSVIVGTNNKTVLLEKGSYVVQLQNENDETFSGKFVIR